MKTKVAKFKNPFDLMDQQQQQIIDTTPQTNYNAGYVPKGKVHTPLPFDPYQNPTQPSTTSQSKISQPSVNYSTIVKQTKKNASKSKSSFSNPFGSQFQQQQISQPQPYRGPIGFNPTASPQAKKLQNQNPQFVGQLNEDGDPPLLEDIGIDIKLIRERILMTIKVQKAQYQQLQNADLSGPIMIAMVFGCLLLLSGKIHFGDIYAMFLFGNTIMYFLINFMNQSDVIPLYNVMSTLGYALLPMLILGFLGIFFSLKGTIGIFISLSIAFWASLAAGNTLQVYLRETQSRKSLIVYPLFLFYLCFGMIVIF